MSVPHLHRLLRATTTALCISAAAVSLALPDEPLVIKETSITTATLPSAHRTLSDDEIVRELARMNQVLINLPENSPDRDQVRHLIRSLEVRLKSGVDPDALLDEITSDVVELRELKLREPIKFRILKREELGPFLQEKLAEGFPADYLPNLEAALKIVGAIPERTNLLKLLPSLLSEQIAGLYDDQTKRLYIMEHFDIGKPLARIILAHEICHALQDQHFNLSRLPLKDTTNEDAALASLSLVEGDATVLMQDYAREKFTGRDVLGLLEAFQVDQRALNAAPYFVKQQLIYPYLGGAEFLTKLMVSNPALRDKAFRNPPSSMEQVLHPDKYRTGERDEPTSFPLPSLSAILGDDWKHAMHTTFGEYQVRTLFEVWREWEKSERVAEGWDGDRYALYQRQNGGYLFAWKSVWDTEEDAKEFFDAFSELMRVKRYRQYFENEEFIGPTDELRMLNHSREDEHLFLRFRKRGHAVIVQVTDRPETAQRLEAVEKLLLTRDIKPVP